MIRRLGGPLLAGFTYLPRAFLLLVRRPRTWGYVAAPLAINVLLFGIGFFLAWRSFTGWLAALLPDPTIWYWQVLGWLVKPLVAAVLLIVIFFTFTLVGTLVGAPFHELLSERVEWLLLGPEAARRFDWRREVRLMAAALWEAVKLLGWKLGVLAVLVPTLFIPVLGQGLCLLTLVCFTALDFLDIPMARKQWSFRAKLRFLRAQAPEVLAFGGSVYLALLVPFLGLLVFPLSVTGATLFFFEKRASHEARRGSTTSPR